jgi:hypothetical protein
MWDIFTTPCLAIKISIPDHHRAGRIFIGRSRVNSLTMLTISFQAIKAALMNPVKSLKTE